SPDRRRAMIERMGEPGGDLDEVRLAHLDDVERSLASSVHAIGKPAAPRRDDVAVTKRSLDVSKLLAAHDDDVVRRRRPNRHLAAARRGREMPRGETGGRPPPAGIRPRADDHLAVAKLSRHHAERDPRHYASSAIARRSNDAARSTLYPFSDSGFASYNA